MEDDSKQRLLQAAIQLFAAHGFESVSIRQIAKAAGTNSAMISYYFDSKQKLYEAAIDAQAAALHALAGKSLAGQWSHRGNTPSTVADALPHALSACMAASESKDDILPWPR